MSKSLAELPDINKLLYPGIKVMIDNVVEEQFKLQAEEFARREEAFKERLRRLAGEIAVIVASAAAYDPHSGVITISIKLPL